jgi:HK97 family phage prohead protease
MGTSTPEERAEVARILARAAPSLSTQLAIKASAVAVARAACRLEGQALRQSLLHERELLAMSLAAERGEPVEWPSTIEYRAVVAAPKPSAHASHASDPTRIYGWWALYDSPARIEDPNEGSFTEVLRFGSLASAMRADPRPPFLYQHGRNPSVGRTPIAKIDDLSESRRGAWVDATLVPSPLVAAHVTPLARMDMLGASFAFRAPGPRGEVWRRSGGVIVRELLDVQVAEISATSTPAYTDTALHVRQRGGRVVHVPPGPTIAPRGARRAPRQPPRQSTNLSHSDRQRALLRMGAL